MISSTDVLQALAAHGTVQWARISVGRDPQDSLARPPMVVWRYVEHGAGTGESIASVVGSFRGDVEWVMDLSGRNWVIMPRRLQQEFAGAAPGYVGVLSDMKAADQDFCLRANSDLGALLDRLKGLGRTDSQ
jgi:hypothetical protein